MNRLFLPMSFASFSLALLFTACSQSTGQQGGGEYKLITVEKNRPDADQCLYGSHQGQAKCRNTSAGKWYSYGYLCE